MPDLNQFQRSAIIPRERGIKSKKGIGFVFNSLFAEKNLFCIQWADEYECDDSYRVQRSFLDGYELLHIKSGSMKLRYDNKEYVAYNGQTFFIDLHRPHDYSALSPLIVQQFLVNGNITGEYFKLLYAQNGPCFKEDSRISFLFNSLIAEITPPKIINEHQNSMLLHEIYATMAIENSQPLNNAVNKAQAYILDHFSEDLSIDKVASEVGFSKYHFERIFKKETGYTPWAYLSSVRVRNAMHLLTETQESIENISEMCGFSNASYFVRFFKRNTNMTPSCFRQYFAAVPMGGYIWN